MNERLDKIFWQARDFARRQQMVDDDFLSKYAELIVRATMQEVERYAESTDTFSMYECAAQVYPKFIDLGVGE